MVIELEDPPAALCLPLFMNYDSTFMASLGLSSPFLPYPKGKPPPPSPHSKYE